MFTKWQQIEEWITDNGFQRWIFFKNNPETREADRANDKVLDSKFYPGGIDDKLALTKKHLEQWGAKAYGWAYKNETATVGACVCEVRLEDTPVVQQPLAPQMPVSGEQQRIDVEQLKASIRKEMEAEFARQNYEREKKEFEKEKREFEKMKSSTIGVVIQQLGPYAEAIAGMLGQKRNVAGIDANHPVTVPPVQPLNAEQPETGDDDQSPFTDEEADKLLALMTRFKAVEPNYMRLIEAVVVMAENGDVSYNGAKMILLKDN